MSTCPTCQPTYSDEVDFCPRDGAALRKEGIVRAVIGLEKEPFDSRRDAEAQRRDEDEEGRA